MFLNLIFMIIKIKNIFQKNYQPIIIYTSMSDEIPLIQQKYLSVNILTVINPILIQRLKICFIHIFMTTTGEMNLISQK